MKATLLRFCRLINQNIALVILVGSLRVTIFSGAMAYISYAGILASFLMEIVICGRIVDQLRNRKAEKPQKIIKDNWANYLVAFLLLTIPVLLIREVIKTLLLLELPPSIGGYLFLLLSIKAVVWTISMYVFPIVFLKNKGWMAVIAGIVYFFANLRQSASIIPYIALMFALYAGASLWELRTQEDLLPAARAGIAMLSTYLSFIVFAAASNVLIANQASSMEQGESGSESNIR